MDVHSNPMDYGDLPTEEAVEREATTKPQWYGGIYRIAACEASRFWRLGIIFGLVAFIYSIMRCVKDALVNQSQLPASISYLKMLGVTPSSIGAVAVITYLLNTRTVGTVFRMSVLFFGAAFGIYALTYPLHSTIFIFYQNYFVSDLFCDGIMAVRGLQGFLPLCLCVNFWPSSLLYLISELWGNVVLSLLFMTYANEVLTFKQSLRFIPLFYIISNIGLIFSGVTIRIITSFIQNPERAFAVKNFAVNGIVFGCAALTILIFFMHRSIEKEIKTKQLFIPDTIGARNTRRRVKPSFASSLIYLSRSWLLIYWGIMTLGYNICTNLLDSLFKPAMYAYAKKTNRDVTENIMEMESYVQTATGLCVIIVLCTPFNRIIQLYGWLATALICPVWSVISAFVIVGLATYNTACEGRNIISFFNTFFSSRIIEDAKRLGLEQKVGAVFVVGMKFGKYAFFDMAKEALAMRIDSHDRKLGKSIIDGIFGKLGKSFGSLICTGLFNLTQSTDLRESSSAVLGCMLILCAGWFVSVFYLAKKYKESVETNKTIDLDIIGQKKEL